MERRFRLQPVLNYRRDREEALQMELAALTAEEQVERHRLSALHEQSTRAMDDVLAFQAHPRPDLGAIQQGFLFLESIGRAIAAQTEIVARVVERVEAKRQEVVAAMQARKAIEKLKERHDATYAAWANRIEQAAIDDMVTGRYNRRAAAGEVVQV